MGAVKNAVLIMEHFPLIEYHKTLVWWVTNFGNCDLPGLFRSLMFISSAFALSHVPVKKLAEGRDQPYDPIFSLKGYLFTKPLIKHTFGGLHSGQVIFSICSVFVCVCRECVCVCSYLTSEYLSYLGEIRKQERQGF